MAPLFALVFALLVATLLVWPVRRATAQSAQPAQPAQSAQPVQPTQERLRGAVILMYHRFGEGAHPSTNIRLAQFEAHLAELRKPRYTVLPVPEIVAALRNGGVLRNGATLPDRTVGITIDDAYASVYREAWPRLKAAGLPFTVFVATEGVDRGFGELMRWQQLRELAASGLVTLGDHSVTHPHMPDHGRARNRRELEESSRRIAAETGQTPTLLAYPYGEYSAAVRKLAERHGFAAAFGQHSGVAAPGMDLLALPRFALNEAYGEQERFVLAVNALPLPVRDVVPVDMLLSVQHNPPLFGFSVEPGLGSLERLACYVSGQGPLALRRIGALRVEGRPERPFPPGRSRINCTLPGPGGRWHWYGVQFYRPER